MQIIFILLIKNKSFRIPAIPSHPLKYLPMMQIGPRQAVLILGVLLTLLSACVNNGPHATVGDSGIPAGIGGEGVSSPGRDELSKRVVMTGLAQAQSSENFISIILVGPAVPAKNTGVSSESMAFEESLLDFGQTLADWL